MEVSQLEIGCTLNRLSFLVALIRNRETHGKAGRLEKLDRALVPNETLVRLRASAEKREEKLEIGVF